MKRTDLLALSLDDLALLSNKGNVKRAVRELEREDIELEGYDETATQLLFRWSDATCTLEANTSLQDTQCTCPSTKICRHLVRSVLHYQSVNPPLSTTSGDGATTDQAISPEDQAPVINEQTIWRPGEITDDALEALYSTKMIKEARRLIDQGVVAEVQAARRPMVLFHRLGCTVKFVVPHHPQYARCTCKQQDACVHIPMAVMVDRQANATLAHGFVSTMGPVEIPQKTFEQVDKHLIQLMEQGVMGLPKITKSRLARTTNTLRDQQFVWPADILEDIQAQYSAYDEHDAQFMPEVLPGLIGEWLIRRDALSHGDTPTPAWFIHGEKQTQKAKLSQLHLIGLGCQLDYGPDHADVVIYFQNQTTGDIMTTRERISHEQANQLDAVVMCGRPISQLASQHLVVQKAKIEDGNRLDLKRAQVGVYPQYYKWETLESPLFQESFDQVRQRLKARPPASLRMRKTEQDLAVVALADVKDAAFNERRQCIEATLIDAQGIEATLRFAYHDKNRHGTEHLLHLLRTQGADIAFIAGHVRLDTSGLLITPLSLVLEHEEGQPHLFQPWACTQELATSSTQKLKALKKTHEPLSELQHQLGQALGQFYLLGLDHLDAQTHEVWRALWSNVQSLGLDPILGGVEHIRDLVSPENGTPTHEQLQVVLETTVAYQLLRESY